MVADARLHPLVLQLVKWNLGVNGNAAAKAGRMNS